MKKDKCITPLIKFIYGTLINVQLSCSQKRRYFGHFKFSKQIVLLKYNV